MEYTIEHNRPLPVRGKYAPILRQLEVGDSVLFTNDPRVAALHQVARRIRIKITVQSEKLGIRVWRIE